MASTVTEWTSSLFTVVMLFGALAMGFASTL